MADHIEELKARVDEIRGQLLTLDAAIAENLRTWRCDGVPTSAADRSDLAARRATLAVDKHNALVELTRAKQVHAETRRADRYATLTALLTERGMSDLIDEANARVTQ